MSDQIGVRELRENLAAVLKRVEAGEVIQVTRDGKGIAIIAPHRVDDHWQYLVDTGRVILPTRPMVFPERLPSKTGRNTEDIINEDRGE